MVSKTDDMSHDPFANIKHPKTPALPMLNDIDDTAFTLSQRVADENGNLVRPEGHPRANANPADVPFPEHDAPNETEETPDEKTLEEERENAPEPVEPSVEEQLNFNLEEENK